MLLNDRTPSSDALNQLKVLSTAEVNTDNNNRVSMEARPSRQDFCYPTARGRTRPNSLMT